jgi:hypothetical protein
MGTQRVFPNLMSTGTSPGVDNSLFVSLLISWFGKKKYFYGNGGNILKRFYIQELVKRPFDLIKKRDFRISLLEPTHQLTDNYFLRTQNHSSSVLILIFFNFAKMVKLC